MLWYTFRDIWQVPEKLHQAKNSVKTGGCRILLTILIGILRKVPIILYKGERFMKNKNRILAFAVAFIMMTQIITVSASGSGGEP